MCWWEPWTCWDLLGYPEQTPRHSPRALSARHTWPAGFCHHRQSRRAPHTRLPLHTTAPWQAFSCLNKLPWSALKYSVCWKELEKREDIGCVLLSWPETVRAWCSTAAEGEKEMKAQQSKCFAVTFVLECKLRAGRAWWQSSTHQQQGLHQEPEATAQPAGPAAEAMLKVV